MAFDNCTELERWQELTDFAAELNRDGDRLHFTFFVSGSNFIADGRRSIYEGPHQRRGLKLVMISQYSGSKMNSTTTSTERLTPLRYRCQPCLRLFIRFPLFRPGP